MNKDYNMLAKAAILINVDENEILFEKNADERRPMASLTKMMTALLIYEDIQRGVLHLNEIVEVTDHTASIRGSRIKLNHGDKITIHDLLKGLLIASGNDAAVALATHTAPQYELFIERMNDRAKQLGLKNTHYQNSHGLDANAHYSSARDVCTLAEELVKMTPVLNLTRRQLINIKINNHWETISNTNKLLGNYKGVDGLKTGRTLQAGFCIAATAQLQKHRLLAVVMGEPSISSLMNDVTTLFDFGFSKEFKERNNV
ncbi:D-alanyl-D-alanine carboxypeptidase family protein [Bacillus solimangrovi]|uniref:Peptidase S11 D-alanyl-D-alanine carboxypeptidase A N-terminal domain-containing protein n=1 Tax=Bacillus solimangrovi TaxID=1305675 RepID=A0A1E5LFB9_9BACI|nr:D-alanyl-D-alanine carboxypeptidase family protein [Bacillus solimangrovi]OEH92777.1 hypothetical protein BFG57_01920 [Bacillus solimangrovi]